MSKRNWWERSAVDDGARPDSIDQAITTTDDRDWLDDFDFDEADDRKRYSVANVWGRWSDYGGTKSDSAKLDRAVRLASALKMA